MNMYLFLDAAVQETPNSIFIAREGITYVDFMELVKARAVALRKLGVKSGDNVGVLSHNIKEFPQTLFALWGLGARALMLDTNLTKFEYDNMTERADTKLIVCEKGFIYNSDRLKFYDIKTPEVVNQESYEFVPAEVGMNDIATLSFTSGSTGIPKVVPLTHSNLIETARSLNDMKEFLHKGDMFYGFLPMYHVFGFAVEILASIWYRGSVLLQPTLNPKEISSDLENFKPHILPAVPRLFEVFRNKIIDSFKAKHLWWFAGFVLRRQNTLKWLGLGFLVKKIQDPVHQKFGGRVRLLIAGGAATKPEVERFYQRFGFEFIQGYGLTETVGPICLSYPVPGRLPFAIGSTLSNNEYEIRDKNADGAGVLWLKGTSVFCGYLNNEAANKESFDDRGFFNTGDLVTLDRNGELHFHGRKKLVIVLDSGKNVYPDELEGLFMQIPGVKNVAVFEHKIKDKTVTYGVFQVEEGIKIDELEKGIKKQNSKLASYKWCSHFAMTTEDLPLTSTTKVKHHEVKKLLDSGSYPIRKE
ncbi:MAG: AMP-binding protein [Rickettsiales bacterium]|jgi:long-chain acyl-CoA synthetase|nr:AMP-binding protein [Rickettsiales bacterium]